VRTKRERAQAATSTSADAPGSRKQGRQWWLRTGPSGPFSVRGTIAPAPGWGNRRLSARSDRDGQWTRGGATPEQPRRETKGGNGRAFRGLVLVFLLSFFNLIGLIVTATALGGLAPWSRWQFIGAFGVLEAASGLANVISPNIWRLPVAELGTGERTDVKLAGSALLLPHWGGLARCAAGVVCLGAAAWEEGLGLASAGLVPFVLALAWLVLAISALLARAGVARPDLDVFQVVVRWGGREKALHPISISAATFQFVLTIVTLPAVKLLPPSVLYQPEPGPSLQALLVALALSAVLLAAVYVLWAGRIERTAPQEQQREAEEHA
jgi:hypothetical protein